MQKVQSKKVSVKTAVAVTAGVVALAAASYYFFGPEGKKNRGKLKGWMIRMKGEIIEKMEDAKDLSEVAYHKIVDAVAGSYAKGGRAAKADVAAFAETLKRQWKGFSKAAAPKKRAVKKASKKSVTKK